MTAVEIQITIPRRIPTVLGGESEMPVAEPTPVPREVPFDSDVPEDLREVYIRIVLAAQIAGVTERTIQRHLGMGTLAGTKMGPRLWYVKRVTSENDSIPAIDMWLPGKPGNPQWTAKTADNQ